MTTILTAQSIRDAEAVACHLHASLTTVLESPPVQGHRAATLSNELGVGRMTCQRIMKLAKTSADPGPELLVELPGVGGLREFLEAVIRAGVPRSSMADAFAAIDAFERYLREIGLSQTGFDSALRLFQATTDPDRLRDRRAKLFDAASTITGQAADFTTSMMAIRPSRQDGFNFEQIAVRGYAGMRASGSAMPIRLPMNMAFSDFRKVTDDEAAREPQKLIEGFCTRPLPSIDSRVIKSEHLAHIIDPKHISPGEPFDCFAIQHNRWNVDEPGSHKAIWLYVDYPTRHCIFDMYLHRSMQEGLIVHGDCHLWGTALLAPPEDLWMTRFADQIRFSELGSGTAGAGSKVYERHQELAAHMFDDQGWNADDFAGFRCEMELPIWRSGLSLVMTLE
ncbi:MAG: hypothetical protein CBB69_007955 [Phycisphaera sp. TMED9]|nr:MAG: hypothetical protein CBB69_007955 [Phycisphaera sp. TMED9]